LQENSGVYTTCLAYVHLKVHHLEAAVTFYTRFLDLQVSERFAQTSLLVSSENTQHFELALSESPEPSTGITLGFVASEQDFGLALDFVRKEGIAYKHLGRGFAEVLQLRDPDGNTVELFKKQAQTFWRGEEVEI
jgi:catechol-2,3-dioxygenase